MVISSKNGTKRNLDSSSSSKSKLNQKSWDFKRKMAEKRLMDLTDIQKKNKMLEQGDYVTMDMPSVCYQPEEKSTSDLHKCGGISSSAMERAEEVQANLPIRSPSFVKLMSKSHVTRGFWLGLPRQFCDDHLPKEDETIVLMGENGEAYNAKYFADRPGLSGGWRGFSIAHKLLEGDAVVFHLIGPCKFKIYIVRARRLTEVDGAMSLLNLDTHPKPIKVKIEDQTQENTDATDTTGDQYLEPLAHDNHEKEITKRSIHISEHVPHEFVDGIKFSESPPDFKDVKRFEDFSIHIDNLVVDSELPKHLKTKYYELCKSQNAFLHENLVGGLNSKLAVGMIFETINIADAIRASKATTPHEHLESWDRTLKAFEDLGMAVGPMRSRIRELLSLYSESRARIESMRNERDEAQAVMRGLSDRLSSVKACIEKLDANIDALNARNEGLGFIFEEIACAPW